MANDVLHEEAKPVKLKVTWFETKIQSLTGLLNVKFQFVHAFGRHFEITKTFIYLGSRVHNKGRSFQEATGALDSPNTGIWCCRYLFRHIKPRIFKSFLPPLSVYGCGTWTMDDDLSACRYIGTKCLT